MHRVTLLLLISLSAGCMTEKGEIPETNLVYKDGLAYDIRSNRPATGSVVEKDEEGIIWAKGFYKNGKREGIWGWREDLCSISRWEEVTYKNGEQNGSYKSYSDGRVREIGQIKNELKNGKHEFFDDSGNLILREYFVNGECVKCELKENCSCNYDGNSVEYKKTSKYFKEDRARDRRMGTCSEYEPNYPARTSQVNGRK